MITHDHKMIFIHIPKCAGRSVCDYFNQRFDHFTARHYEDEYPIFWKEYFKFTIVRNPFARLVSIFTYIQQHRRHYHEAISCNSAAFNFETPISFKNWATTNIRAYNVLKDMLPEYRISNCEGLRGYDGILGSPFWFTSQYQRIVSHSGHIELSAVYQLETQNAEINEMLSNFTKSTVKLPHSNKSSFAPWQSFYDQELIDIVSKWAPIAEDCKQFNYKF